MKKLCVITVLLFFVVSLFAKNNDEVILTCSGSARTESEAINVALRSAIEQTYGTFISASTNIQNDKFMKDEAVAITRGNIKNYKKLSVIQMPNGDVNVSVKATVSVGKVINFAVSNGATINFDGSAYAMNAKMIELRQENTVKAFAHMCEQIEAMCQRAYDWKVVMETPKMSSSYIDVKVEVRANKVTEEIYKLVNETLRSLSLTSSEIEFYEEMGARMILYSSAGTNGSSKVGEFYDSSKFPSYAQLSASAIILPCLDDTIYYRQKMMFKALATAMSNYILFENHSSSRTECILNDSNTMLSISRPNDPKNWGDATTVTIKPINIFEKDITQSKNWYKWNSAGSVIATWTHKLPSSSIKKDTFRGFIVERRMNLSSTTQPRSRTPKSDKELIREMLGL